MPESTKVYGKIRLILRHGTLKEWETENPILLSGEKGVVIDGTDGEYEKIGDGVTPWNNLPWNKGPKGDKGDKGDTYSLTPEDKEEIASITSEEVAELREKLISEKSETIETEQGAINNTTGADKWSTETVRTDFISIDTFKRLTITSGVRVKLWQYTADKAFLGSSKYGKNGLTYIDTKGEDIYKENCTFDETAVYIRLAIIYNPTATITPNDVSVILTTEVHTLDEIKADMEAMYFTTKDEKLLQGIPYERTGDIIYPDDTNCNVCTDFIGIDAFVKFSASKAGIQIHCYQFDADKNLIGIAPYGEENKESVCIDSLLPDGKDIGEDIYKENYTFDETAKYIRLNISIFTVAGTPITPEEVKLFLTVNNLEDIRSDVQIVEKDVEDIKVDNEKNSADIKQLQTAPFTREFLKEYINNVLCIGDSLTQGCYYNGGLQGHSSGKAIAENYPYFLSKMSNWNVKNAGVSGYSPVNWWEAYTHQDELTEDVLIDKFKGLNFADYDFYIIWLGTNGNTVDGVTHGLTDTLDNDVIVWGNNYNDFSGNGTGCYCKIISAIIEANPYARIVLGNVYTTVDVYTTNKVIYKIAKLYSDNVIGVVDMSEFKNSAETLKYHPFHEDAEGNVYVGIDTGDDVRGNPTHLGKVGNLHVAKHFLDEITRLISENELKYYEYLLPENLLNKSLNDIESQLGGI